MSHTIVSMWTGVGLQQKSFSEADVVTGLSPLSDDSFEDHDFMKFDAV